MEPLGPFASDRRVMVAVSGGPDSMALALLLAAWGRPLAAVVDHGLRVESAAEAALTRRRLDALGIPSIALRAHVPDRSSEAAREERYRLLLAACSDMGLADLCLGHHQTDQAETVRMRADRGSTCVGLAGMAAMAHRGHARLLRPLLATPAPRLRATLRQAGVAWVTDPSNDDLRRVRARLRQDMTGLDVEVAVAAGAQAGERRARLETAIADALQPVEFYQEGFAVLREPLAPASMAAVIASVSGRVHPASPAALAAGMRARTLCGVIVAPAGRLGPGVLVGREPAAVTPPVPAEFGTVWDGRFRVGAAVPSGLEIGALGEDARRWPRHRLPALVRRTLPAFRRAGNLVAVPHLRFPDAETCRSVPVWFCPRRPASAAPFHLVR